MKIKRFKLVKLFFMLKNIRKAVKETIDVYKTYTKVTYDIRKLPLGIKLEREIEEARQAWKNIYKQIT